MIAAPQSRAEWHELRLGRMTASRARDVIAKTKATKAYTAERDRYLKELVVERITGEAVPHFVSAEMEWGTLKEPEAVARYETEFDLDTIAVGFTLHPTIPMFGATPDRAIGVDGLLEVKCPKTQTHVDTVLGGVVPEGHLAQIDAQFACCPERLWLDFVSFDPRIEDDRLRLFRRRVTREERADAIKGLEVEARIFLAAVDERIERLREACASDARILGLPEQQRAA